MEIRQASDGRWRLTGYASVTETPYPMCGYVETVRRGAFIKTLAQDPDVVLLLNHEGLPLARTRAGTMSLQEDETGLLVDADLDRDDPEVVMLSRKFARGDISEMSFAFRVDQQEWSGDFAQRWIEVVDLQHGDVSVVTNGANPATSAAISDRDLALSLEQRQRRAAVVGSEMRGCVPAVGYGPEKAEAQRRRESQAVLEYGRARVELLAATSPLRSLDGDWLARARIDAEAKQARARAERAERLRAETFAQRVRDTDEELARLRAERSRRLGC